MPIEKESEDMAGRGITANPEAVRTLGGNVKEQATLYKNEVNKIYAAVDELKTGWQGTDNQSYVNKVNEYRETITNLGNAIEDYGTFLTATANELQRTQDEIASAAGRL